MATRLLRQYYEPVATAIPDEVGAPGAVGASSAPDVRRPRALPDAEWHAATRCTDWDVKDVVSHLVTVDAYWMFAFNAARTDDPPTTLLEHFDPSSGTDVQAAALREVSNAELADRFANGTDAAGPTGRRLRAGGLGRDRRITTRPPPGACAVRSRVLGLMAARA